MKLWRKEFPREVALIPTKDEVIFKRHECEWILPLSAANHFRYNPRHLPAVILQQVTFAYKSGERYVQLWEETREDHDYKYRLVYSYYSS